MAAGLIADSSLMHCMNVFFLDISQNGIIFLDHGKNVLFFLRFSIFYWRSIKTYYDYLFSYCWLKAPLKIYHFYLARFNKSLRLLKYTKMLTVHLPGQENTYITRYRQILGPDVAQVAFHLR